LTNFEYACEINQRNGGLYFFLEEENKQTSQINLMLDLIFLEMIYIYLEPLFSLFVPELESKDI